MNNRILTIVCLIFLCACIAASTVSYAAASGGNATSTPEKSKAGREKGSQDVYKQALEEMTPLTIGWTSDARSKALQMDDGIVAPLDLATRAVRATALPYRDEMVNAWRKLPPDKESTAQVEVDRFEKKLIQRIADFIVEWRRYSSREGGGGNEPASGGPQKE